MSEPLLTVRNVWKKYSRSLSRSLSYGLRDSLAELVNRRNSYELRKEEFWALRKISFELRRGEALAVVGPNGAGKTTLLRVVSGLLKPDRGEIRVRGRIERLINTSAGLNPMLSGLENLQIRAKLRGLDGAETKRFIEQVVEFADLANFIDSPLQFYSSGMRVRLGFSASIMVSPDILIIDEILAVGDLGFKMKCYEELDRMMATSVVLLVTHSMNQVSRVANVGCYLEKGRVVQYGDSQETIRMYIDRLGKGKTYGPASLKPELLPFHLQANGIEVQDGGTIQFGTPLSVVMDISRLPSDASFRIVIRDASWTPIIDYNSQRSELAGNGGGTLRCDLGPTELRPGRYFLLVLAMAGNGRDHVSLAKPIEFRVEGLYLSSIAVQRAGTWMRGDDE